MKTFTLATAVALSAAIAAPALANDQLARSLGLEPGVYTTAELATLKGVMENRNTDDAHFIASLLERENGGVVSTKSVGASSQLARSLGVDGSNFSGAELAAIKGVIEDRNTDDTFVVSTLIERANGGVVSTKSVGASSQLARSLGLDASDFTAAEIATIKGVVEQRNTDDRAVIEALIAR